MNFLKTMMLNCEQATFLVTKREQKKLSFKERFDLMLHLSMCKFCSLFAKQSAFIARQLKQKQPTASGLSEAEKERMVQVIQEKQ
ncbi:MAG: hypothetical protein IPP77_09770 [Bacteroidetes bacterium]|nr:hypothetical protein [Bacteroidota bacterium]